MKAKNYTKLTAGASIAWLAVIANALAASVMNLNPTADAFVSQNAPSTNYGAQGTLAVAGTASGKGAFESVLKFELAAAVAQFNTEYGAGSWSISSMSLLFASNLGNQGDVPLNNMFPVINGGLVSIQWMQDDSWTEGGIRYDNLGTYTGTTAHLATGNYVPPGNNVQVGWTLGLDASLVSDATAGGSVSFLVSPGDATVSYLFNSRTYNTPGNHPVLVVTAIPEPMSGVLAMAATLALLVRRRRQE